MCLHLESLNLMHTGLISLFLTPDTRLLYFERAYRPVGIPPDTTRPLDITPFSTAGTELRRAFPAEPDYAYADRVIGHVATVGLTLTLHNEIADE